MWTLIKWEDTTCIEDAWSSNEDIAELRPLSVATVVHILSQTETYVTEAGSVGLEDGYYWDVTCIPKGCIVHMAELKESPDG